MALILFTGTDPEAMRARQRVLEINGHRVVTALNQTELSAACREYKFDVAVIGQTLGPQMKQHVVDLVREYCPSVKVLELYPLTSSRTIKDADSWIGGNADVPKELVDRIAQLTKAA
jgi:ActR/RegA family two-component response regulator